MEARDELCFAGKRAWYLPKFPYNSSSAQVLATSTHGMVLKNNIDDAASFMSTTLASEAHHLIFCSDLLFFHWSKSLRARRRLVENVEADLGEANERPLHVTKVKGQTSHYTTSPKGVKS